MKKIKAEWMERDGVHYCSECGWGLAGSQSGEPCYMGDSFNRDNPERWIVTPGWIEDWMNYCPRCGANMNGESEES